MTKEEFKIRKVFIVTAAVIGLYVVLYLGGYAVGSFLASVS